MSNLDPEYCNGTQVPLVKSNYKTHPHITVGSMDGFMGNADGWRGNAEHTAPSRSARFPATDCYLCELVRTRVCRAATRWIKWAVCSLSVTHLWRHHMNTRISYSLVSDSDSKHWPRVKRWPCAGACLQISFQLDLKRAEHKRKGAISHVL